MKLIALTIKIDPRLLDEIDEILKDSVRFRSRGHIINCAVDDWLNSPIGNFKPEVKRLKPKEEAKKNETES